MNAVTAADPYLDMDLLRVSTAGSVDDGKSTLIGRLLYDTKSIFADQLEAIEGASRRRGDTHLNLALLTDGLRAEREQNITIDVAYRYFATPRRKFIIADTPGHFQYTRNMVTGASTAEMAIVLVDARRGVLTQSKRHGFIASLLRIPHVLVAVNKMDLVDFREEVYREITEEYRAFAQKLDVQNLEFVPISALNGDNVVEPSAHMPWYDGGTLLHHLETAHLGAQRNLVDFRFPVQYIVRPHQDFRGFAGRISSGTISPGEEVVALPSGRTTRVREVLTPDGFLSEAAAGDCVVVTIEDEIDVSRGDMLVRIGNLPSVGTRFDATLCWMSAAALEANAQYVLLHTTREVQAQVTRIVYRIDVDTLHREETGSLALNDLGRVEVTTAEPVFFDPYARNQSTGSFILIDPFTHATVAAGMIRGEVHTAGELFGTRKEEGQAAVSPGAVWEGWAIDREAREARNGHRGAVLWFTGLSGAGKSTIAREVERRLFAAGVNTILLDSDPVRQGLCGDLGFSDDDRRENIRRAGAVAHLLFQQGALVLCTFVSPFRQGREQVRQLVPEGRFIEIHVDCDLKSCRQRDPKGLYARAARGEVVAFTGISSPYEPPTAAEITIRSDRESAEAAATRILDRLREEAIL